MLTLHGHPFSTYTRRVRIALAEKRIAHDFRLVDMAKRGHRAPEYLALNPYGRVPTLVDDDFVLYESTAILGYLEAICPEPPLVPAGARDRARVDMHMKLCDLQLARPCGTIIFPKRFLPQERWDRAAMAQAKTDIEQHLAIVAQQLGDHEWMVADRYTLVEVCYTPFLQFLPLMEIEPPAAVADWAARMLARPAARETAPAQ